MAKKAIDSIILKYYDEKLKAWITVEDGKVLEAAKEHAAGLVEEAQGNIDDVVADLGDLENLETTSKSDLVSALNEVKNSVTAGNTASAVTMTSDTTTEGALKSYTIKQGETTVGVIDIPKDMVVQSGEVVTNPEGKDEGTYIKLVLANVSEPLFINVGTLVDIYKAKANATQIQVTVDSSTREISAVIVAGSVGTTELADNAVTTAKIADGNITLAKLSTGVQASLGKADTAVQTIEVGGTNGTIKVDGEEVAVAGLGSAAYKDETAFDPAGSAAGVQSKLDEEVQRAKDAEAKVLEDAIAAAQEYADEKVGDVDLSGIQKNAEAIKNLTDAVGNIPRSATVVDETTIQYVSNPEEDFKLIFNEPLVYGDNYIVWYDGVQYNCVAESYGATGIGLCIGGTGIGDHIAGVIHDYNDSNKSNKIVFVNSQDAKDPHTVAVYKEGSEAETVIDYINEQVAKSTEDNISFVAETYETKEDATAKYDEVKAEIEAIPQADWNQNNETAADYVKNRTHYEDVTLTELVAEKTINIVDGKHTDYDPYRLDSELIHLVVWDDVKYYIRSKGGGSLYQDGVFYIREGSMGAKIYESDVPGEHTVAIYLVESSIKQLDEKFIPDTIARASDVNDLKDANTALSDRIKAIPQADWNQNNETAADYVKNRTHYISESFVDVIPEKTYNFSEYTFDDEHKGEAYIYADLGVYLDSSDALTIGDEYNIILDGISYRVTATATDRLGNYSGSPDPIYIEASEKGKTFVFVKDPYVHTFSVQHVSSSVIQLDEKFIPDTIARVSEVEALSDRVAALEETEWATEADIDAMFATTE